MWALRVFLTGRKKKRTGLSSVVQNGRKRKGKVPNVDDDAERVER